MMTKSCKDFENHPDWKGCCQSCHEDHDEFNYDLLYVYRNDTYKDEDLYAIVCCYVIKIAQKEANEL